MQHFEARIRMFRNFLAVIWDDIFVPNSKSGGIKFEFWLFFGGNSYPNIERSVNAFGEFIEFSVVIKHRNDIFKSTVDEV